MSHAEGVFTPTRNSRESSQFGGSGTSGRTFPNGHMSYYRNRNANRLKQKGRKESPSMTMVHLNSQVQQLGGLTPGKWVFGRDPKMPIGPVGGPHFLDFANRKEARSTKARHLLGIIHQIRQASSAAHFNGELNLRLNRRFPQLRNAVFLG